MKLAYMFEKLTSTVEESSFLVYLQKLSVVIAKIKRKFENWIKIIHFFRCKVSKLDLWDLYLQLKILNFMILGVSKCQTLCSSKTIPSPQQLLLIPLQHLSFFQPFFDQQMPSINRFFANSSSLPQYFLNLSKQLLIINRYTFC